MSEITGLQQEGNMFTLLRNKKPLAAWIKLRTISRSEKEVIRFPGLSQMDPW